MSVQSPQSGMKPVQQLKADNYPAASYGGLAVDASGFRYCVVYLDAGICAGTIDLKVEQSETGNGSWTDVTGAAFAQVSSANDDAVYVGVIRCDHVQAYLRLNATVASAACDLSASFLLCGADDEVLQDVAYSFEV